jgi:hypothetical protein
VTTIVFTFPHRADNQFISLDVTSSLTTLIVDGISSHSYHLDSFVVLHASLVTSLYKVIGNDFGKVSRFPQSP